MEQGKRGPGRPKGSGTGRTVEKVNITMPPQLREWAMKQPGGMSATIRRCLEGMQKADRQQ